MNMAVNIAERPDDVNSSAYMPTDVWERRFQNEGRIWGDAPSPPARFLTKKILTTKSKILEIGAGYGRDSNWFVESGHTVTAIDRAANALTIATPDLMKKIGSRDVVYIAADFRDAAIGEKTQDVFFGHRVLHLLGHNGVAEAFANMAAKVLKPEGKLLVTARSRHDFNEAQMHWIDENQGIAEYKKDIPGLEGRDGQRLYFWDENSLRALFSETFESISIVEDTEIESLSNLDRSGNPTLTTYLSISATRKVIG